MISAFIKKHTDDNSERIHILIDIVAEKDTANMRLDSYFAMQPEQKLQLQQYIADLDKLRVKVYQADIPLEQTLADFESDTPNKPDYDE